MKKINTQTLVKISIIAALYAAVTIAIPFLSFPRIQIRFSEALTILPVFAPFTIPALFIGCVLSNIFGLLVGNPGGPLDIIIGSLATLIAAYLSYKLRKIKHFNLPILSTIPPVLVNAVILGLEFTFVDVGRFNLDVFMLNFLGVFIGQSVACIGGGLLLYVTIKKLKLDKLFEE